MKNKLYMIIGVFAVALLCIIHARLISAQSALPAQLGEMTIHVVPQAHIDLAWWWRYDPHGIHIVCKHTMETAFTNMELYPDYTFTFLQVPAIDPLETLYPELYYKLQYYLHAPVALGERIWNPRASGTGRLEIAGGMWDESDGCLPCGESVVRQCLYGKRYFHYKFGIDVRTAWFQDAWTHPWTYPQILKKSGIDSYMFKRGEGGNDELMFWWEAPDGSRVFAYKPGSHGGENLPPQDVVDKRLIDLNRRYGTKDDIVLVGVGNHGGGPLRADVERMKKSMEERMQKTTGERPAAIKFSTPSRFLETIMKENYNFPVVANEITPTFRGAYTSVSEIKKGNRHSENLLMTLEKFSSIAAAMGIYEYPHTPIYEAWKKVMLNQFHDTISGTDILPATDDAINLYKEVLKTGAHYLHKAMARIAEKVNTQGDGIPIIVFNPLSWERTGAVEIDLEAPGAVKDLTLSDDRGNQVPVQIAGITKRNEKQYLHAVFVAENVPSIGYKTYHAIPKLIYEDAHHAKKHEIENEFLRVRIDPMTGCVESIFDKKNLREILDGSGKGNLIQILEDFGDSEGRLTPKAAVSSTARRITDYPDFKWTDQSWDVDSAAEIGLIENGPVRTVVQVKKKFELSRFTQKIILYSTIPRVDFEIAVDWIGQNKMVKVSFPLSVSAPEATYEIPYGTISRPSIGEEHVAQKWVDVSAQDYGVSLLNDSRYGYDVNGNVIRLSILRSPSYPVYSTDERGTHTVRYSLYPHMRGWREAKVMRQGYELNYPLLAAVASPHSGDLPPVHSFVKIEPENLIISVLKKAEDSDNLILRFYETEGKQSTAQISLSEPIDAVHKTDLLENSLEEIGTDGKNFRVAVGAYSIESFKLIRD